MRSLPRAFASPPVSHGWEKKRRRIYPTKTKNFSIRCLLLKIELKNIAKQIKNIPIWFLQGTADEPCPIDETRSLISELHKLGATPLATEYDGVDHDSLTMALEQEGVFRMVISQQVTRLFRSGTN